MTKSILDLMYDKDYANAKDVIEDIISKKIVTKLEDKKKDFLETSRGQK